MSKPNRGRRSPAPYTKYQKKPYVYSPKLQQMQNASSDSERRRLRDEHTVMMLGHLPRAASETDRAGQ